MYNFKTPSRGEPIDVTTLAKMGEYIAGINEKLLADRSAKSSVWAPVPTHVDTADLTVWTGKILIADGTVPKSNSERVNWSANFDIPFRTVPIVTATPYCDTTGGGTKSASSIWIHNITTTGVKGKWNWVKVDGSNQETVYALIIAIGEGLVS